MENKIKIEKIKKRVPVPRKPPKVQKSIKEYDRNKEKDKTKKIIGGDEQ